MTFTFSEFKPPNICFPDRLIFSMLIRSTPAIRIHLKAKCSLFGIDHCPFFFFFYQLIRFVFTLLLFLIVFANRVLCSSLTKANGSNRAKQDQEIYLLHYMIIFVAR